MATAVPARQCTGFLLTLALSVSTAVVSAAAAPDDTRGNVAVRVSVVFRDATGCAVSVGSGAAMPATSAEPSNGDFVCPLTGIKPRTPVILAVTLPLGVDPTFAEFPRLEWRRIDGSWTGTASLPSAPAFVRVGGPSGALARRARWLDVAALIGTFAAIIWTLAYSARRAKAGEIS